MASAKLEDESCRHSPYSPDLAPFDFHLLGLLKNAV